jgi:branched-chain amino acid transport system permease protein
MSVASRAWDAVPGFFKTNDTRLILGVMLGLYVLYFLVSLALGLGFNGTINTLQRITFLTAVYAMLVLALNLHWGYTGLFNIGVAGFMAVGVYTMGILANAPTAAPPGFGLPLPVAILGGVVAAAIVGGIAALPALRLEADYLAIVTVGLSEIIRFTFLSTTFQEVTVAGVNFGTGGGSGIGLPENPVRSLYYNGGDIANGNTVFGDVVLGFTETLGIQPSVTIGFTYALILLLVFVTIYYVLLVRIGNSPFGRVLKAIREDELVASSLGKNTNRFKIKAFMVGCALMGLGGILWQGSRGFVNPTSFRPILTFYIFTALIIGGAGSNTGSVIGGAVFASLLFQGPIFAANLIERFFQLVVGGLPTPNNFYAAVVSLNPLAWLGYGLENIANLRFVLLGVVLIYMMQNRADGLLGHRKEVASSVDLTERTGRSGGAAAADGGEVNDE